MIASDIVCRRSRQARSSARHAIAILLIVACAPSGASQFVVTGPVGSGEFGRSVNVLPNGNVVVTDPSFDGPGTLVDIGAAHLYRANGVHLSTLRGAQAGDRVGSGGITVLSNGHYVVLSPQWQNEGAANAGAASWCSGETGCGGAVSGANSLVGSSIDDGIDARVVALADGDYVVASPRWDRGALVNAGAVAFGSGADGIAGPVGVDNSLVGSRAFDAVGTVVTALPQGNYVVGSPDWDDGTTANAGAATFGPGHSGITGFISPANSLLGSSANDRVGEVIYPLANGNYVVSSFFWNNGPALNAGAATFASGTTGTTGVVSATNSLVGTTPGAFVAGGVKALSNGNYVVESPQWSDGSGPNIGAATFGSGVAGISGVVSSANSVVGRRPGDAVGEVVESLVGGNYVVRSSSWRSDTAIAVGAVTFGSGTTGIVGEVSPANSLVGMRANDRVGSSGIAALSDGNYVVASPNWDDATATNAGAVTYVAIAQGTTGVVSAANSLVGTAGDDRVGSVVVALHGGAYAIASPDWDFGAVANVGAVTFVSGASAAVGTVTAANSLRGETANDRIGRDIHVLLSGDYLVPSRDWDFGGTVNAGALTFADGGNGLVGVVSALNSLIGSSANDRVGDRDTEVLASGHYLVDNPSWDDGSAANVGALTLGLSDGRVTGPISAEHSVIGSPGNPGISWSRAYDAARNQLVVGQPNLNRLVLHRSGVATATAITADGPDPSLTGQPVTFVATVVASPRAPDAGVVTFRAASGETCMDEQPAMVSATTSTFSCVLSFSAQGTVVVTAEYTGSLDFAFSGSAEESHATRGDGLFDDGFEAP